MPFAYLVSLLLVDCCCLLWFMPFAYLLLCCSLIAVVCCGLCFLRISFLCCWLISICWWFLIASCFDMLVVRDSFMLFTLFSFVTHLPSPTTVRFNCDILLARFYIISVCAVMFLRQALAWSATACLRRLAKSCVSVLRVLIVLACEVLLVYVLSILVVVASYCSSMWSSTRDALSTLYLITDCAFCQVDCSQH